MDFGKIAIILSQINTDALDLEDVEYLPSDFWVDFEDGLGLADFVAGGWAEPTEAGKSQLELVWRTLCDIRERLTLTQCMIALLISLRHRYDRLCNPVRNPGGVI